MRIKNFLLLFLIFALLFSSPPTQVVFAAGGTISGYVKDEIGNPLSGVDVLSFDGITARTNKTSVSGYYILTNVPAGTHHLRASEYPITNKAFPHYWDFKVADGGNYNVNFTMHQGNGQICGRVIGSNGIGLANIIVNVYEKTGAGQQSAWVDAKTQASGDYCTNSNKDVGPGLPTGSYVVQASGATTISHDFVNVNAGQITPNINLAFMAGDGSLSGRVTDIASGLGLANAVIYADGGDIQSTGVTDSNGAYLLLNLPYRSYNMVVSKSGYATSHRINQVSNSTPVTNFNFQLTTQKGSISGRVTNGSGNPIQGVNIFVDSDQGTGYGSILTDANGNYSIPNLAPMLYYVHASKSGYANQIQMATAVNGQTTPNINFTLGTASGSISGRVLKNGQLAGYAKVFANSSGGVGQVFYGNTTADANGNYSIGNLVPGPYDVHVSDVAGYANQVYFSLSVGSSNTTRDFNLTNGTSTISGRVTDLSGNPIPGVSVQPFNNANPGTWGGAITDINGNYSVHNMWAGMYTVYANMAGYNGASKYPIYTTSNATTTVNFVMGQQGRALVSMPSIVSTLAKPGSIASSSTLIDVTSGGTADWTAQSNVPWLLLGTSGNAPQVTGKSGGNLVLRFNPDKVSGMGTFSTYVDITCADATTSRLTVTMIKVYNIYSTFIPLSSR